MVQSSIYDETCTWDNEQVDPRIKCELDTMNSSTVLINNLNTELEAAQCKLRTLCQESQNKLERLFNKYAINIENAKSYYDSRVHAKKAKEEMDAMLRQVENCEAELSSAQEIFDVAALNITNQGCNLSIAWQEMLNSASEKVRVAKADLTKQQALLKDAARKHSIHESEVKRLHKRNRRAISKSKSYYELMAKYKELIEAAESDMLKIKAEMAQAKNLYSKSMCQLEVISEQIHEKRRQSQSNPESDSSQDLAHGDLASSGSSDESASLPPDNSISDDAVPLFSVGSSENLSDKSESHNVHQWLTKSTRAASFTAASIVDEHQEDQTSRERSSSCLSHIQNDFTEEDDSAFNRTSSLPDVLKKSDPEALNVETELDDASVDKAMSYRSTLTRAYKLSDYAKLFKDKETFKKLPDSLSRYQKYFTLKRNGTLKDDKSLTKLMTTMKLMETSSCDEHRL